MNYGFRQIQCDRIDALQVTLVVYEHLSGFKHYHLKSNDAHLAASLAFRTLPPDNSGLPHILEHCVLCGSERYPVRDPFFMMLRRSMQTFMNAMTGADCTWYPIASLNEQDFLNLFNVYADAVFRPRLHELDIAQEGFRWDIDDECEPSISGIVYNEMKGVYADKDSVLYQALCRHMLPDTPYALDSGGDPLAIPDITPQQLRTFHQSYYRAANGCCSSYGKIQIESFHNILSNYLSPEATVTKIKNIPLQQHRYEQKEIGIECPAQEEEINEHSILCAWLWGDGSDALHNMLSSILEDLLIGHAAAPLRLAIESSNLCQSIDGSGFLDYCRSGIMNIEMHGCKLHDKEELINLIENCIDHIIASNFDIEEIENAIHQNELQERYIGGDREPHGLQLCESLIDAWNYKQDPISYLDSDRLFRQIRSLYNENQRLFVDVLETYTRTNKQQLILYSVNKTDYFERFDLDEAQRQQNVKDKPDYINQLRNSRDALTERQKNNGDMSVLPQLALEDITECNPNVIHTYPHIFVPSNGISQISLFWNQHVNDLSHLQSLRFLSQCIGQLGHHDLNYQDSARLINARCGHFQSTLHFWDNKSTAIKYAMNLDAWGLHKNLSSINALANEHIKTLRLDEEQRLDELIKQFIQQRKDRIISHGNSYAAWGAAAACSDIATINNQLVGIPHLQYLNQHKEQATELIRPAHEALQELEIARSYIIGDSNCSDFHETNIKNINGSIQCLNEDPIRTHQAFIISSEIQFNAMAFPAPEWTDPDAPALSVAGYLLGNLYLHPSIRESGGAYGASSYYSSQLRAFICSSYRDPHLDRSFAAFVNGIEQLATEPISQQALEEAIISSLAELQRPGSPFTDAKRIILRDIRNETPAQHLEFQRRIKQCSIESVQSVVQRHLLNKRAYLCSLASEEALQNSGYDWYLQRIIAND